MFILELHFYFFSDPLGILYRLLDALGIRKIWQAFCIGYRPSYLADSAYDNTSEKFPLNPLRTAATANEAIMKQLVST